MTGPTIVEVSNLGKSYTAITALDDVSFSVQSGEVLTLLGPNGAGKTTLIKLLLGRLRPCRGEIQIFGLAPGSMAVRRQSGTMLQVATLPETVKVSEQLQLFRSYYPAPMAYQELLHLSGLEDLAQRYCRQLSVGQKQCLLFALAICGRPRLLLLDEPSVGMDIRARQTLWRSVEALKAEGTSVILTTHYLEEADQLSDRILLLQRGRVIREGTPAQIKATGRYHEISFRGGLSLTQLQQMASIEQISQQGERLSLRTRDPSQVLRQLLSQVERLDELNVSGASLEDAFLALDQNTNQAARSDA